MDIGLSCDMFDEDVEYPSPIKRGTPERGLDDFLRLATYVTGAKGAVVSLIDNGRHQLEAHHGIATEQLPYATTFCRRVSVMREALVIADAEHEPHLLERPSVKEVDAFRFCAGIPLRLTSGQCIGALCVFDPAPRDGLSPEKLTALRDLARICTDFTAPRHFRRTSEIAAQVMDATSTAVACVNDAGTIIAWNGAAGRMFGRPASEVIGKTLTAVLPAELTPAHQEGFGCAFPHGAEETIDTPVELLARRADGSKFPAELSFVRWSHKRENGGFIAIIRDISARRAVEIDRQNIRAFLDTVIAHLPISLSVKDAKTHEYLLINRAGEELFGKPAEQIVGRTMRELFPARGERYEIRDRQVVTSGSPLTTESAGTREDGSVFQLRTRRILIDGSERSNQYILSLSDDVTEIRQAETAASLDRLTGLINRKTYIERLTRLIGANTPIAMLNVDLARFRSINDQFGHQFGDKMLVQVADRLRLTAGPADLVARVGGNEFTLLLIGDRPVDRARLLAEALVECLAEPFLIDQVNVHSGACIGIATAPDHAPNVDEFRRSAELALQRAKRQGRGGICCFDAEIDLASRERQLLEIDLREAIDAGDITVAYQPVMSVAAGKMTSVEALARWTHPVRGPVGPDVFIPLAEECGLIHRLGEHILRRACLDAMIWPEHLRVAVNLSPMQFQHGDLYGMVCAVLADSGLPARRLQLEVTEGLLIRDVERTFIELERLRMLGIHILMDDFGVGYSSLSYFERFPFDMVKIDKSFIDGLASAPAAKAIIKAVVGLGQDLAMGVVAEGVETEEQAKLLAASGCTHLQGYFFSRPLPAAAISEMADGDGGTSLKMLSPLAMSVACPSPWVARNHEVFSPSGRSFLTPCNSPKQHPSALR